MDIQDVLSVAGGIVSLSGIICGIYLIRSTNKQGQTE